MAMPGGASYAKLNDGAAQDGKGFQGGLEDEYIPPRGYEICMVFKCKTSKFVRDPLVDKDNTALQEPDEEDKEKMEFWRQRREAILKSLQQSDLKILCFYSRDRDEVVVKVGANPKELRSIAARMRYKLQLKKQYLGAYAEYRPDFPGRPERGYKDRRVVSHIYKTYTDDDFPDSDAIFKSLDKIHLINRIITSKDKGCAGINIGKLIHDGELRAYFPLHEGYVCEKLKQDRMSWFMMPEDFANQLRDYFGDKIAFYFVFMAFYWKWLMPIAIFGLAMQFIDVLRQTPDNPTAIPFCVVMSVWCIYLPHFWRRQEAKYAIGWGTLDLVEQLEPCRPEHHGDQRINPVTSQVEPYYPPEKRRLKYVVSVIVMCIFGGFSIFSLLLILYGRHQYRMHTSSGMWAYQLGLAAYVELMNAFLTFVSRRLTVGENHRTQSEHDTALLVKVMIFKFVNSYLALFYTAFYKNHTNLFGTEMKCWHEDCFLDLSWQLAIFVVFRLTFTNVFMYFSPRVKLWWRSLFLEKRAFMHTLTAALNGKMVYEVADMSAAEQQSKRDKYDEFYDSDEMLLNHGYATFFAVTSPWVVAATLLASLLQIVMDMKGLMDHKQRPMPTRARSNDPWSTALEVYGVLASSTNVCLLIFASEQYEAWTFTEKLVMFIFMEHLLILARVALKAIFPEVPSNVELQQLKQEHMVHRCLENIKVEQTHDFSMFRERRGEDIEVFEHDILERDDEEVEPSLDLAESAALLAAGLKDAAQAALPGPATKS